MTNTKCKKTEWEKSTLSPEARNFISIVCKAFKEGSRDSFAIHLTEDNHRRGSVMMQPMKQAQ